MRLDTSFRKDIKYPDRDQKTGYYHGYGGVRAWTSPTRDTARIRTILVHTTDNPHGNTRWPPEAIFLRDSVDVSSGYVVSSDDNTVIQIVPDEVISWNSGDCKDNDFENLTNIGVEIAWTFGKGPLPRLAIDNTTELVQFLLRKYPSIVKIDTHRNQAVPKGRKPDPIGWDDIAFYQWRDQMLRNRNNPPILTLPSSYIARYATPIFTSHEHPDTVALDGQAVVGIGDVISAIDLGNGWLWFANQVGFAPSGAFRKLIR